MLQNTTLLKGDLYAQILESQAQQLREKIAPHSSVERIWDDLKPFVPENMRMFCTRGFIYSTKALIINAPSADDGRSYNLFLVYRVSFHLF